MHHKSARDELNSASDEANFQLVGRLIDLFNASVNYFVYKFLLWRENQKKVQKVEPESTETSARTAKVIVSL